MMKQTNEELLEELFEVLLSYVNIITVTVFKWEMKKIEKP